MELTKTTLWGQRPVDDAERAQLPPKEEACSASLEHASSSDTPRDCFVAKVKLFCQASELIEDKHMFNAQLFFQQVKELGDSHLRSMQQAFDASTRLSNHQWQGLSRRVGDVALSLLATQQNFNDMDQSQKGQSLALKDDVINLSLRLDTFAQVLNKAQKDHTDEIRSVETATSLLQAEQLSAIFTLESTVEELKEECKINTLAFQQLQSQVHELSKDLQHRVENIFTCIDTLTSGREEEFERLRLSVNDQLLGMQEQIIRLQLHGR